MWMSAGKSLITIAMDSQLFGVVSVSNYLVHPESNNILNLAQFGYPSVTTKYCQTTLGFLDWETERVIW